MTTGMADKYLLHKTNLGDLNSLLLILLQVIVEIDLGTGHDILPNQ